MAISAFARRQTARWGWSGLVAFLCIASTCVRTAFAEDAPFMPLFTDRAVFEEALAHEAKGANAAHITGLIVPHHVLAADLIARAFQSAGGNSYDRIIIMSPDHFNRSKRPFATTTRDIDTVFGTVANDRAASASLAADTSLFEDSDLFSTEHGVAVLLPFIKRLFPAARIVPVAISYASTHQDWDRAFDKLNALVDSRTLVVQSTDFSHYLPAGSAIQRDQESLNILAAGDIEAVDGLVQPAHLDSKGAFYLQMRIQAGLKSVPTVIANRNSVEYEPSAEKTTSYVVAAYSTDPHPDFSYKDQTVVVFGGDIFAGRGFTGSLANPDLSRKLVGEVLSFTHGAPLVVNLEGVVVPEIPPNVPADLHAMDQALTIPLLHALHVEAASLANNHSFDLGAFGLDSSEAILAKSSIRPLRQSKIEDLGPFRVVTLNYVGGRNRDGYPLAGRAEIDAICHSGVRPPVIAFTHWGVEYTGDASEAEDATAAALHECGVSAVIGAHSHKASKSLRVFKGGEYLSLFSLGNLVFDQSSPRASGALLELRFFHQGTFAARLMSIPNVFDEARQR